MTGAGPCACLPPTRLAVQSTQAISDSKGSGLGVDDACVCAAVTVARHRRSMFAFLVNHSRLACLGDERSTTRSDPLGRSCVCRTSKVRTRGTNSHKMPRRFCYSLFDCYRIAFMAPACRLLHVAYVALGSPRKPNPRASLPHVHVYVWLSTYVLSKPIPAAAAATAAATTDNNTRKHSLGSQKPVCLYNQPSSRRPPRSCWQSVPRSVLGCRFRPPRSGS